jgi:hypothetical protein
VLSITPGHSDWTGSVDSILIQEVINSIPPVYVAKDDDGNITLEIRTGDASKKNFSIGYGSGSYYISGEENLNIGYQAGGQGLHGNQNASIGYQAGYSLVSAEGTLNIGYQAGYSNESGWYNVFIGNLSGYSTTGGYNTFMGYKTGYTGNATWYNTFIGANAGEFNGNEGTQVTAIGCYAGNNVGNASDCTLIGAYAGYNCYGNYNVMIGGLSGYGITSGVGNTYIGEYSGVSDSGTNDPATDDYGILIGYYANRSVVKATKLTNYIGIGKQCYVDKSNQVKIGNTSMVETQLYGTVLSSFVNNIDSDLDEVDSFTWSGGNGLLVISCTTDSVTAVWRLEGTTFTDVSVNALFTNTKDNAATYNVYFESGALKIQNKVNNNKVIKAAFYGV